MKNKKSLGQNWLKDRDILIDIADHASAPDTNVVVEIGPGLGTLTSALFQFFEQVIAVELDDRLAENLPKSFPGKNLTVVHKDVLQLDLNELSLPENYVVAGTGKEVAASGIELKPQITEITDRLIQSGEWKNAEFRKYDIQTFAPAVVPAKKHPLSRLGAQIRRMFTDMGFVEMSSEYVQPSFWNLDVLFTPQDHPARDLQDTFYLENPSSIHIDDEELLEKIRNIHENGADTGSTGWGGKWSREMAESAFQAAVHPA